MLISPITYLVIIITIIWIVCYIIHRSKNCSFWRHPDNDRRSIQIPFHGEEKRRREYKEPGCDRKNPHN